MSNFKVGDRVAYYNIMGRATGEVSGIQIGGVAGTIVIRKDLDGSLYSTNEKCVRLLRKRIKMRMWRKRNSPEVTAVNPRNSADWIEFVEVKQK